VRDGGSAVHALMRLGLHPLTGSVKSGDLPSLAGLGLDPVTLEASYTCPTRSCGRVGRHDERGHTPICEIDGAPMPPTIT